MKSIKNLFLIIISATLVASCNTGSYKKTAGGMPYKVFAGKDTQSIKEGNIIKVQLSQVIKDSVYYTTGGKLPLYLPVTATPQSYDISEVWTTLKVGDSIITTQLMDTFMARSPGNIPPQFKKGDKVMTYAKIIAVFANDSLAKLDDAMGRKTFLTNEIAEVEKYLADNKITAQKTPSGAFVQIINPGAGSPIDSGNYVSVDYSGVSFSGKKFDSNTDTTFHHMEPLSFTIGSPGGMIKGFDEGVKLLKLGGSGKVFVPSLLGYGGNPGTPLIKPYEHLIFDITVKDVKSKMPARPEMRMPPPPPPPPSSQSGDVQNK